MDWHALPFVSAQTQPAPASSSSMALLALRRWFAGLTLSSPQTLPDLHPFLALLAGLALSLLFAIFFQGPLAVLKQIFDIPGHVRIVRDATKRVWQAGRLIAVVIGFTVLGWTGAQALVFMRDDGTRPDLALLTKSRALWELGLEQGILAGLTPLRDLARTRRQPDSPLDRRCSRVSRLARYAGLGNPPDYSRKGAGVAPPQSRWSTAIWGSESLYALYRAVGWGAGSGDLPLGGCLVVEAALVPVMMLICDGFLVAWVLTELRNAGLDTTGEDRLDIREAIALLPASALACLLVMPARYLATFVWLSAAYLPTWVQSSPVGRYIRWQLGWGLTDLQAVAFAMIGFAGVVAWSRGSLGGTLVGFRRLLTAHGGHIVIVLIMASSAAAVFSGCVYALLLLLPTQGWVLSAADAYAHYATLPVSLWTVAAVVILMERARSRGRLCIAPSSPRKATPYKPTSRPTITTSSASQPRKLRDHSSIDAVRNPLVGQNPFRQLGQIAVQKHARIGRRLPFLLEVKLGGQPHDQHASPPPLTGEKSVPFPRSEGRFIEVRRPLLRGKHPPRDHRLIDRPTDSLRTDFPQLARVRFVEFINVESLNLGFR